MGPRYLQSQIHADYSTGSTTWSDYRDQIKSMYDLSDSKEDFNDHLIREYNRKIERLNQQTGLYISPFDGGFRFIGDSIASVGGIVGFAYPNETLTAPSGSSYLWTVNGTSRGTNQTFVPTVNDIGEVVTCLVGSTTYTTTVWHPRDISSVQAFWWAAKNTYNVIGNGFTDANRPVVYNGSITLTLVSIGNYSGSSGENTYYIYKDETTWVLEIYNVGGEEPSLQQTIYSTNDDTQYPWQSTWPSGTTITPVATTTTTLATDGQTIPAWDDIISNQRATASSSNIALKEDTDLGGPSLKFDSTDYYALPSSARAIYNSKRWGYIFVGAKDSNPYGGDNDHGLVSINRTSTVTKIGLTTRDSTSNVFSARTNPIAGFTTAIVNSSDISNSNYNVLTNESLWAAGKLALRINGVEDNFDDSFGGTVSNNTSTTSYIGATTSTTDGNFNGDITTVILASNIGESDEMSEVDRNRLERFVGLLGGLDIPLI